MTAAGTAGRRRRRLLPLLAGALLLAWMGVGCVAPDAAGEAASAPGESIQEEIPRENAREEPVLTPDQILPGEPVPEVPSRQALDWNGTSLEYHETRSLDVAEALNFQNTSSISSLTSVYLAPNQDIYSFDESGALATYVRVQTSSARAQSASGTLEELTPMEAAIAAAGEMGVFVTEELEEFSDTTAGGGFTAVFQAGKAEPIDDRYIITLNEDNSLKSFVAQRSGIDSMDEVDVDYFDSLLEDYCEEQGLQPTDTDVTYRRYGGTMAALYSVTLTDEAGGVWVDSFAFADIR